MADITSINFAEVSFEQAVRALRDMVPMSDEEFDALSELAKQQAFTFSGAYSDSMAQAVQNILADAAVGDVSRDQWLDKANLALDVFGESLTPYQAQTIYETTLAKAYGQGKDQAYANPVFRQNNPYVAWVTAHDARVRPNHFALDFRRINTVFPQDDPLWKLFHEPAGFRCRCTRLAFSADEVTARGLQIGNGMDWYGRTAQVTVPGGKTSTIQILPDPGFGSAGLVGRARPQAILRVAAMLFTLQSKQLRRAA